LNDNAQEGEGSWLAVSVTVSIFISFD